jgi:cytochrome P450
VAQQGTSNVLDPATGKEPGTPTLPGVGPDGGAALLAWAARMREEQPAWRDDNGNVHVFRHADVLRILADPATFSSDTVGRLSGGEQKTSRGTVLLLDPPLHGRMRRLVSRAFTPGLIAGLEPWVTELTEQLLEAAPRDAFDLVDVLANPLPVTVIAGMLGVPAGDIGRFQVWADQLLSTDPDDPEAVRRMHETGAVMAEYLQDFIDARRAAPTSDLLSTLAAAELDGERLEDEDIASFAILLLLAGHITTAVLVGNALICLDQDPALLTRVRADRSLIPAVIEETLRLRPPFTRVERVTTVATTIAGLDVGPNTLIHIWLLSANRDERVFEQADEFRVDRSNAKQAAFGHGIHYCIGAPLARLEARVALEALLDRYAAIRVDPDARLSWHGTNVFGARHLPLLVRPA